MTDDEPIKMPTLRIRPRSSGGWLIEEGTGATWLPIGVTFTLWGARWQVRRIQRRYQRLMTWAAQNKTGSA